MWWSRVATTCAYSPPAVRMWPLIADATAAPPATARLPPSQKSFWTSTTSSARVIGRFLSCGHRLQRRLPPGECPGLRRQRRPCPLVVRPRLGQSLDRGGKGADLAGLHEGDDEVAVAVPGLDRGAADDLGQR